VKREIVDFVEDIMDKAGKFVGGMSYEEFAQEDEKTFLR